MSSQSRSLRANIGRALILAAFVGAAGCSDDTRKHGFVPLPEDLAQLAVGVTTRDEAIALIGPPTTRGAVESNTLYYVQSERTRYGPFEPEIVNRELVAVRFTPGGTLSNVERFGLEDGRVVVLSRRITDDGIADVTFIGQLLGAIGNIDAGTIVDGPISGVDS